MIRAFIEDIIGFMHIALHWRFAGILFSFFRFYWRGIVFASARTHKIVYANSVFLDATGWTIKDFRKRKFLDFVHSDDYERTIGEMSSLKEGSPVFGFVNRYEKKSGGYVRVKWNAAIIGNWYLCEVETEDISND